MIEQITPYKATHPGEVLLDELNARGIRILKRSCLKNCRMF